MKKSSKSGFTLAEVLIALTIIGVIAALTVPALVQKTQKQEYVSALQKTYSTLSQASNMIIAEHGSPKGEDSWADSTEHIYQLFKKKLIGAKDCAAETGCFAQGYTIFDKSRSSTWDTNGEYRRMILADGSQIMFYGADSSCESSWSSSNNSCGYIWADVNGEKKPNIIGRDIFNFSIKETGLYPAGCDTSDINMCTKKGATGKECACKVLREGAMNY